VYRAEQLAAWMAIIVVLPLAALLALAIYVLSRRSPLVRHSRVGKDGAPLSVLKFRTMWDGTETPADFFTVEDISANSMAGTKNGADARVTSHFAALCRKYSLDEIPQLYHVARGQMSLVGPRPLTARELSFWYGSSASEVLTLRPGLTGLWQVSGRNRLTYAQRKRLDVFLVKKASASFYFYILLRTLPRVLLGDDAY
jgi:lipopolysaccharide/colanic/teichoic acid biosynthesis glycosyltransferase